MRVGPLAAERLGQGGLAVVHVPDQADVNLREQPVTDSILLFRLDLCFSHIPPLVFILLDSGFNR
jgi:hypothetical protein